MTERVESEGFYEMLWDCEFCSTKGLLGRSQRHCPECGAPQNPDKRYFPSPEQQKKVEGHSYEGADRYCPACKAPMAAKANNCTQCGSPLDGSKDVRGVVASVVPKRPRRRILLYILAGALLLAVTIWWLFVRKQDAELMVTGHHWERSVAIEEYRELTEAAWRDQVPPDVRFSSCHRRQRSTKQIPDGEDCHIERVDRKDGTFEQVKRCKPKYRAEPVDDDWCTFQVRRWKLVEDRRLAGQGTTLLAWPERLPAVDTPATLGAQRSGARTEKLRLDFAAQSCEVDAATWRKYSDGQKIKLQVRARSGNVVCSSL